MTDQSVDPNRPNETEPAALFRREDILAEQRSRWGVLIPGTRVRVGVGAVALAVVVAVLFLLAVFVVPDWFIDEPKGLDDLIGKERVDAENALEQSRNAFRTTLVQAIGGLLVLSTFAVALANLFTVRRGQIIDRFTNAVEQLGHDRPEVRLGGIYALEQMAADPDYARQIGEILAAYLKTRSASDEAPQLTHLDPDRQAVLRILVLEGLWSRATAEPLDLSYVVVPRAELRGAQLRRAVLLGATLRQANLTDAKVTDCDLRNIEMSGAFLRQTTLQRVDLTQATLSSAILDGAKLTQVHLMKAKLNRASLRAADLSGVDATGADLTAADLRAAQLIDETRLVDARLVGANFAGANLADAKLIRADLTGADFTRAVLMRVDFTGAILNGTIGLDEASIDATTREQIDLIQNQRR